jgi:thioredoxin-related protein
MKQSKYLLFLFLAVATGAWAQADENKGGVAWMSIEEALEKSKKEPRKIFVDVYTDWCGWCKVMDRETFSDPEVARVLNEKFYAVKLNAETKKEDVTIHGTTFKYVETSPGKGIHQLAAALLQNQLSYPTVVFLAEDFSMISPMAGFKKPAEFHVSLSFVASDAFKRTDINTFVKDEYKSPYAAGTGSGGH